MEERVPPPVADALRELGIMLRKSRITASHCASGFRLASFMKDLGVDEDTFGQLISETYNHCGIVGLQPEYIAYNTKQLLDLSGSYPDFTDRGLYSRKGSREAKIRGKYNKARGEELDTEARLHQAI